MIRAVSNIMTRVQTNQIKRSKALDKHQRAAKSVALHGYDEDCCASDSSGSDYSENRNIRNKTFPPLAHGTLLVAKDLSWIFWQNVELDYLPREAFHKVMLTVAGDVFEKCSPKSPTTVLLSNNTSTEYHCGCTVDGNETIKFLVHCRPYHTKVCSRQNFRAEFFDITFCS